MRLDDERRRPLWAEQDDEINGYTLSPVERFLDELDNFPRTKRLTDLSAPRTRTRPAGTSPSSPAGHILQEGLHYQVTSDGCWVWLKGRNSAGYGQLYDPRSRKSVLAHRLSYEAVRGEIPEGLQIDHLCRVRACVNPDHLEAVTQRENMRRGNGTTGVNARKTHCHRGHPFDEENTRFKANGTRNCRACQRISDAIRRGTGGNG